jgi:maltooligosyltrehalose trehalohydrolase
MQATGVSRRLPIGAELSQPEGVHFRVWAPRARRVDVMLESDAAAVSLEPESDGYHGGVVRAASVGARYRFCLDGGDPRPDPASRFQPEGPHGPSCVVDASTFRWTDTNWRGVRLAGQVIYEMHIGTFTPEGTWEAAARELPELARVGISVIELMPVADFPGSFRLGL